ncbi:trypsin alpha [Drosophila biarmipes]|uniref:trypsin alpha n=1 Tax=Drosophila biarmipes TaxID=125945 RepID=UPI0007E678AC|nr:trypsin alpha [Drosophila biarmipes]
METLREFHSLRSQVSSKLLKMIFGCFLLLLALDLLSAGSAPPRPEERVIGGRDIEIEQAPWQVSLQYRGRHYCGGSIYSKDIIITAAHCRFTEERQRLEAEDFEVRVGSALSDAGGRLIKVAAIKSFEPYTFEDTNDIAVMRLSEPLEFSEQVQPIPLAKENPARGSPAFTSGWGAMKKPFSKKFVYPRHLQGIWIRTYLPILGILVPKRQDLVYAGSYRRTSCNGDSGGPLVVNQQLVGVVSGGFKGCITFAKYTSVPYFRKWILNAIESIS